MRNYNNYADMITFSRASSGTALAKISYGSEMVTNGTFDTDLTGWTATRNSTITWQSGTVNVANSTLPYGMATSAGFATEVGKTYIASGEIVLIGGGVGYIIVGNSPTDYAPEVVRVANNVSTTGTFSATFKATASTTYIHLLAGGIATPAQNVSFDNISIKPVLFDQPNGTLELFNHFSNNPRVEYDYQGNRLGLLVEEARTNTIGDSNVFLSDAGTAVSSSAETAPDGTTTATQVVTSGASVHRIRRTTGAVTATGVAYAYSVFVKSDEVSYIQLLNGGDGTYFANFDLVNETVGSTGNRTTGTITKYPNGWYRITALYDGTGNYSTTGYIYAAASALATYGQAANTPGLTFHLFGAQNEAGPFPTSYIPTIGSTTTRSADVASIGVTNFGYNKEAGTTVVRAVSFAPSNFRYFYSFHDNSGGYNNSSLLFLQTTSSLPAYQRLSAGAYEVNTTQSIAYTPGQITKFAVAEAIDDMSFVQDANDPKVDTAGVLPLSIETMNIGSSPVNSLTLNGHISSITYYPRRLTNAQIQKLTSVSSNSTLSLTFDGTSDSYLETNTHG